MTFILTNYIIFNLDIYFTYYIIIEKKIKLIVRILTQVG